MHKVLYNNPAHKFHGVEVMILNLDESRKWIVDDLAVDATNLMTRATFVAFITEGMMTELFGVVDAADLLIVPNDTLGLLPPQCEHEDEIWGPQEGCQEFMDGPEALIRCENNATIKQTAVFPCSVNENGHATNNGRLVVHNYLCDEHGPDGGPFIAKVSRI
jgi:hypothetical protein